MCLWFGLWVNHSFELERSHRGKTIWVFYTKVLTWKAVLCPPRVLGASSSQARASVSALHQRVETFVCVRPVQGTRPPICLVVVPQQGRGAQLGCLCYWRVFTRASQEPLPWSDGTVAFCRLEGHRLIDQTSILPTESWGAWALLYDMGSPYFITDWKKASFDFFRKHEKLFIIIWKKYTVLSQVYAVECIVTKPSPTGCRLRWLRLTVSVQGQCRSHLCCRLVAAESLLGALLLGREQGASCSRTLRLTDHPCSCCVVYILLLRQVRVCVCVWFKNHLFLVVISAVPQLHWNHRILLTTLENLIQLEVWLVWRFSAHFFFLI